MSQPQLFECDIVEPKPRTATPAPIGTGPAGETCGSCRHCRRVGHHDRTYLKCALVAETRGAGTDIRKKWAACRDWKPKESN